MTSRVVPAIGAVIAASCSINTLKRVLLPEFGGPARTTRKPSRKASARGRVSQSASSLRSVSSLAAKSGGRLATSFSSAKSSTASSAAELSSKRVLQPSTSPENAPPAIAMALLRCNSVSAESRSASPSASARSILPWTKARRVNSPEVARRNSGSAARAASTAAITARPPWQCSSAISSPVAVAGPGSHSASARSITSPPAPRSITAAARRGAGSFPASASKASPARGPLIRITAIAAGGAPLERAKIVSLMAGESIDRRHCASG